MEKLIAWLPQQQVPQGCDALVHGDFRIDNLVFARGNTRVIAVLDWELSTVGDPLADFAHHCLVWRMPPGDLRGMAGAPLAQLGIPPEPAYRDTYLKRMGLAPRELAPEHWRFMLVLAMFRLIGILQGVARRAELGNAASSERAQQAAGRIGPLAEQAWDLARGHSVS